MGDPSRGPRPQAAPSGWELAAETIAVKMRKDVKNPLETRGFCISGVSRRH